MKKLLVVIAIGFSLNAHAQAQELQQLALNIEKLAQLKSILDNMYKGYAVLTKGYNTIKDISEGNFTLHQVFLNSLLAVSPSVRNYKKIADIITMQVRIVSEYKSAYSRFKSLNLFKADELDYMSNVYSNLFDKSVQNLDDLVMVITANKLRMNDADRLAAIDRIHTDMTATLSTLRGFNGKTNVMADQRQKALNENIKIKDIYGIQK
jgi:hypothetical protein